MLYRKIYQRIETFYESHKAKALMITGARQVGKSYIVESYGRSHYSHFVKLDFIEHPEYADLFAAAKNVEEIFLRLTALFGDELVPGETMIFFDEVQACQELITQIKYLVQNTDYAYILSGSLLGTVLQDIRSVPVGYLEIWQMFPLDFEEFVLANGVSEKIIHQLQESFQAKTPVDAFIHDRMLSLFELYLIVGGMPAAVTTYLDTKNLRRVAEEQMAIISLYKQDIAKYDSKDKLYLNEIFDLIPSELNAKNKRFILKNLNENAKFSRYDNSFLWLKNAGVALPVHLADEPKVPLILSKASNLFKLFLNDIGLLAAQYGNHIQLQILQHETAINFGAIYENVAAQEFTAHGHTLYYYNSKKYGELDFLIERDGHIVPIEIKSGKNYYRHNAMDHVLEVPEYGIAEGWVFCNGNVESQGKIQYYPIYMLMFVKQQDPAEDLIYAPDFTVLNQLI